MGRIFSGKKSLGRAKREKRGFFIIELVVSMALLIIFIKGICVLQGRLFSTHRAMQQRMQSMSRAAQVIEQGQRDRGRTVKFSFKNKASRNHVFSGTVHLAEVPKSSFEQSVFYGVLHKGT